MEQKSSTYEADSRSPLKKLNLKNNKQVDECDNQRKNVHLFDIEASILENSVMVPAYFDPGENIKLDNGDQTNQENLNPRYFVLNNFDPILCQEAGDDEILRSAHDNCVPRSLLSYSFDEHLLDENSDSSGDNKTFVTEIVNDYVEKATELSETRNGIEISNTIELNLNNVYNNAETLNESLIIPTEILQVADVANSNDLFDASSSLNNRYLRSPKSDIANRHVLNINIINPLNITSSLKSDTTLEDKINWSDTKEKQFSDFVEQTLVNEASYEHSILESTLLNETNTQNDSKLMKTSSAYDSLVLKFHSLELSDISESTVHTYDEDLENKNYSSETMNEKPVEEKLETANIIHENNCANTKTEEIVAVSTLIQEKMQMSTTEQRSEVNESVVGNKASMEPSATCTNEMSEIINQDECFEKESCLLNSTVNDTAECEKYKMQILELKEELKSCRQKTVALECEVVNIKRKENELNVILEEYKQSAINKDEQLKCLEAKEELLKNEMKELIKQHEIKLKELQRKDIDEQDEQLKYMQTNEEMLKNEIKDLKAFIKQNEIQSQSDLKIGRVMEEYEKSISSLIKENEKMKKERDTAQMHLANIEMAFSDVHQKYERCKAIVQGYKDNEESFKQDIAMNRETIAIQEQKYETLKAHAMAQLEKSNQELAAMRKQHDTEMARLTAQLKRYEIKNMSLMESLQQKAKECEQLSAVCDEFIGNV